MEWVGGMNPDGGGVLSVWPSPREFGGPTICTSDALLMLHVASMCASVQGCICHKPLQLSPRRPHAEQRLLIPDAVRDCRLQMHAACMLMIACLLCPSITSASRTVSPCRTSIEWPLTKPNDDRIPRANALMLQGLLEGLGGWWMRPGATEAARQPVNLLTVKSPPKAVISRAVHPSMPSIPRQPPQKYKRTKRSPCPPHRLFHPLPSRQPLNLSNSTQAHWIWWWCTTAQLPIKYLPLADYGR